MIARADGLVRVLLLQEFTTEVQGVHESVEKFQKTSNRKGILFSFSILLFSEEAPPPAVLDFFFRFDDDDDDDEDESIVGGTNFRRRLFASLFSSSPN